MTNTADEALPPLRDMQRFTRQHVKGDLICRQGERGSTMFVVIDGEAEIVLQTATGEVPLAVVGKGRSFGEISLVTNQPRTASVRASSDTLSLVEIDKARFVYLVGQQPAFALTIMARLCSMVSQSHQKMQAS